MGETSPKASSRVSPQRPARRQTTENTHPALNQSDKTPPVVQKKTENLHPGLLRKAEIIAKMRAHLATRD